MELRDALKSFRSEIGVTQTELATRLCVNTSTVARWESGKTFPNRSVLSTLLDYAYACSASGTCVNNLKIGIANVGKNKFEKMNDELYTVEHTSLSQLLEDADFPLYVCDMETDVLLYMNKKASEMTGVILSAHPDIKCYECIMHRDSPCPFCHKNELVEENFIGFDAFRPQSNTFHRVRGKLIRWNGHNAQVRYIQDIGRTVKIETVKERELAYQEQLRIRQQYATQALISAQFNISQNKVIEVESVHKEWVEMLLSASVDDVIKQFRENQSIPMERDKYKSIDDRGALMQLFYNGQTHIVMKHFLTGLQGYYESTFDLMQNPVTFQIEAFYTLRDITDETALNEIKNTLLSDDYESLWIIDAHTGAPRSFLGKRFEDILVEQEQAITPREGVESYLRKYCADDDIERVIQATRLDYIKQQLEKSSHYSVIHSLKKNGDILYRRLFFSHLGCAETTILCAIQDITDEYRYLLAQCDGQLDAGKTKEQQKD
jgi:transcriptional regulator with XRE-family HTH domain